METDWKADIGSFFAEKGVFRVEYLNHLLFQWCREYVAYLTEFRGVTATCTNTYNHEPTVPIPENVITIEYDEHRHPKLPFEIRCYFNELGNLKIRYPVSFDYNKFIKPGKEECRSFDEQVLTEPERIEKGYVLQLFNIQMRAYFEKREQVWKSLKERF